MFDTYFPGKCYYTAATKLSGNRFLPVYFTFVISESTNLVELLENDLAYCSSVYQQMYDITFAVAHMKSMLQ